MRSISINRPGARDTLKGVEKAVTFVIAQRIHLIVGGQSYSFYDTSIRRRNAPRRRKRGQAGRADERPRGRGKREGGRHRRGREKRWWCSRR